MSSGKDLSKELFYLAADQDGCFNAKQASKCGYSQQSQSYHLLKGDWIRESRGIYRLAHFPVVDHPDLMVFYLWTADNTGEPQGVFSHDTALDLYNLSTWTRHKKVMTVPPGFRRRSSPPGPLYLYYGEIKTSDITRMLRVPITKPLKTIIDLLLSGHVPEHHLWEAIKQALERRLITHEEMVKARLSEEERGLLVKLLKDVKYDKQRIKELQF